MAEGQDSQNRRAVPPRDDRVVLHGYLTRDELTRELGVAETTLATWDREKTGPVCFKIGQTVIYSLASLSHWLERKDDEAKTLRDRAP